MITITQKYTQNQKLNATALEEQKKQAISTTRVTTAIAKTIKEEVQAEQIEELINESIQKQMEERELYMKETICAIDLKFTERTRKTQNQCNQAEEINQEHERRIDELETTNKFQH